MAWAAWLLLALGLVGAVASVRALWNGHHSDPNLLAVLLVFVPYLAGGMLLQITGKARLAIIALFLPALIDVVFACALNFGQAPRWNTEVFWRATRSLVSLLVVPIALGVGIWLERDVAGDQRA
jgi:hypothetical protein